MAVGLFVVMATVALWLYTHLKMDVRGFLGRDGLPLHMLLLGFLVTLVAGLGPLEVVKWPVFLYLVAKAFQLLPWRDLVKFQYDNRDNLYGVPFFVGLFSIVIGIGPLQLDLLSAIVHGALEMVVLGIAVLRSDGHKWLGIYGVALWAIVYLCGISGGIAAVLAMVVFYFGGSMPGATISILVMVILYFAYAIGPWACMLVQLAIIVWFPYVEIMLVLGCLSSALGLWHYGWYLTIAYLIEICLVKNALAGAACGKRMVFALALFVGLHNYGEWGENSWPIIASTFVVAVFLAICMVVNAVAAAEAEPTPRYGAPGTGKKAQQPPKGNKKAKKKK